MQRITTFILSLCAVVAFFPTQAAAQTPLEVQFEQVPLFLMGDFKPLDVVTRWVRVTNNTNATQPVIIETINESGCLSGPYCLADRLRVQVFSGATEVYNGMLSALYAAGEVVIDSLPVETTRQYDIRVTFETGPDDDNNYQILTTGFDLLVGYRGAQSNTASGPQPSGLLIARETSSIATSSGGVLVTWVTNFPATSQVIYGLASGGPYTLNLSLPNYGYPNATVEDSTKVLAHSVLLTGLTPGATYRYRVISHASPATASFEHEFTVPNDVRFAAGESSKTMERLGLVHTRLAQRDVITPSERVGAVTDMVQKETPAVEQKAASAESSIDWTLIALALGAVVLGVVLWRRGN